MTIPRKEAIDAQFRHVDQRIAHFIETMRERDVAQRAYIDDSIARLAANQEARDDLREAEQKARDAAYEADKQRRDEAYQVDKERRDEALRAELDRRDLVYKADMERRDAAYKADQAQRDAARKAAMERHEQTLQTTCDAIQAQFRQGDIERRAFEERVEARQQLMEEKFAHVVDSVADMRHELRSLKSTMIVTAIGVVLTVIFGIASFNAMLLSNMDTQYKAGEEFGTLATRVQRLSDEAAAARHAPSATPVPAPAPAPAR